MVIRDAVHGYRSGIQVRDTGQGYWSGIQVIVIRDTVKGYQGYRSWLQVKDTSQKFRSWTQIQTDTEHTGNRTYWTLNI